MIDENTLYKRMLTIRLLEDRLQELCYAGEAGDLHFNKGQEAIPVGTCSVLRPTDYMVTHHRTIAHSLSKGIPLKLLVAEILGKATGVDGGRAGEMHISHRPSRYLFSFQLVGTCVPVSAGVAWAVKNYLSEDNIVVCFFGDAATSNGQAHEGLNIANVRQLPLLLICENNGLAGNIRQEFYLPTKTVAERAAAYGMRAYRVDGNKLPEVVGVASEASNYVRESSRPCLVEMETTRMCWHKQGQRDVRSKEELEELAKRDPILFEEKMLGITEAKKRELTAEIRVQIEEAIAEARNAPLPQFEVVALKRESPTLM